jgi:hypothetical protein
VNRQLIQHRLFWMCCVTLEWSEFLGVLVLSNRPLLGVSRHV